MEQTNDQWLWFVDDELVDALARHDTLDSTSEKRPVQSAALAKALSLNMEGKTEQALREISAAIESGEALPELDWTKAHLEFQLGQYEDALRDYAKVLGTYPNHKAGVYNTALCLEKLERFEPATEAFRKAAEMDPKLIEATLGVGVCQLHLGRAAEALPACDACLRAKPG
jgi:tetratricopeptide (TPR) repeat protein